MLAAKKESILNHERRFARELANKVIDLPKLNFWMILIPIILIYHIYRHNHAVKGRSAFAQHYLLSRARSLQEAADALAQRRPPDINNILSMAVDLPDTARPAYREWITVLVRHYGDLLQAEGTEFDALVQSVYRNRSTYLLHLNQLNQLEKALNAALSNHVAETAPNVDETISRIESRSAEIRRLQAESIFPG